MKNLLVKHGEKLLLLVVLGICVFVVLQNIDGLLAKSGVDTKEQAMIEKIKQELATKKPPVYEIAPYRDTLRRSIEGNGIALRIAERGVLPTRLVHEIPVEREDIGAEIVYAQMGVATSLTAKSGRGRVELNWSAPSTDKCAIERYDVFRNGAKAPIGTSTMTSFVDSGLSPQTEYSYSVRVVGRIDKSDDEEIEIRWKKSSTMRFEGELCYTPNTTPVSAKTPSDLALELRSINGGIAVIHGKKWDSKQNAWVKYSNGANVTVGNKVRPYLITPQMKKIYLETGYLFKSYKEEKRIIKIPVKRPEVQEDGSFITKIVLIDRTYRVTSVLLQVENGTGTKTLEYWPIKPPKGAKGTTVEKPRPVKPSGGSDLDDIKNKMKDAHGKDKEDGRGGAPKNTYATTGWKKSETSRDWVFVAPEAWEVSSAASVMNMLGLKGLEGALSDGYGSGFIARNLGVGLVAIELNGEAIRTSGVTKRGWDGLKGYVKKYALKAEVGVNEAGTASSPVTSTLNDGKMAVSVVSYKSGGNDYVLRVYAIITQGKPMIVYAAGQKMLVNENKKLLDAITVSIK